MFRMLARNEFSSRPLYQRSPLWVAFLVLLVCSLFTDAFGTGSTAEAYPFSNPSFQRAWQQADYPVIIGAVTRGYTWGPEPFFNTTEPYAESPGGMRQVAYLDKARMEITNPNQNPNNPYYVTNGLLVKEMVTGLLQQGDYTFSQRFPAYDVPVAGDPVEVNPDAPTYASFYALNSFYKTQPPTVTTGISTTTDVTTTTNVDVPTDINSGLLERQPDLTNHQVSATLARNGTVGKSDLLGETEGATYVFWERTLGHNIPAVFWNYLNQTGPIFNGKGLVQGNVFDWVQTMGYPITDAYWVRANVAGIPRDVMVQLYERRILTYTPANPVQFRVEMGNVGMHYYKWRYSPKYNLNLPLQSNTEVKPEAGFPGTTFSIRVYGMLGQLTPGGTGEDIRTTIITPNGQPLVGNVLTGAYSPTGFSFFPVYIRTDQNTPPGQYEIDFVGATSGNQAKAYFYVLGIPGYNLPA